VCKPEFRAAFGEQLEDLRSGSSLSSYTIRPSTSLASLASFHSSPSPPHENGAGSVLENVDISTSAEQLLANLSLTSPSEKHTATPFHLNVLDNLIREAADIIAIVSTHYRTITVEATKDLQMLRKNAEKMQLLLDRTYRDAEQAMHSRGLSPILPRRRCNRESEDSQATAVSLDSPTSPVEGAVPWPEWHGNAVLDGNKSSERIDRLRSPSVEHLKTGSTDDTLVVKGVVRTQPEEEQASKTVELTKSIKRQSGTTKLKAWMKRKLLPADISIIEYRTAGPPTATAPQRPKLEVIPEQQAENVNAIAPLPVSADPDLTAEEWMDGLLRTSHATLQAAGRDLDQIRECIASVCP
jgi:hypothetical protein